MLEKTATTMFVSTKTRMMPPGTVPFDCDPIEDGEHEFRRHQFFFDHQVWEEMGNPETITVTVEKGDKLND